MGAAEETVGAITRFFVFVQMSAVLNGHTDVVRVLLEAGADTTIGEKDGYTPMHGAGFQGRADIALLLIKHGLNPSDRHSDGFTPVGRCVSVAPAHQRGVPGRVGVCVRVCVAVGVGVAPSGCWCVLESDECMCAQRGCMMVNSTDPRCVPGPHRQIHRATWGREARHTDTIRVLVEEGGVDVDEPADNGQTALQMAQGAAQKNDGTIKLLKKLIKRKAVRAKVQRQREREQQREEQHADAKDL